MATKPNGKNLKASSADILNAIRNDVGGSYAESIPAAITEGQTLPNGRTATQEDAIIRLREIGNALFTYQPHLNSFLNQLIDRIGLTIISNRLYRNPWAVFKRGILENGESVEELFVEIAQAHQYDPEVAESEVFKQEIPDVLARFHRVNYEKFYKVTIREPELRKAFLSWTGINDLISKLFESLYTAANYDEFLMMKYLIAKAILNGQLYPVTIPSATLANSDEIVKIIKKVGSDVQYMSTDYNFAGVTTYTDPSYLYHIMTNDFSSTIDVGSLAMAFNLDKMEFIGHTVGVNTFSFSQPELERLSNLLELSSTDVIFTGPQLAVLEQVGEVMIDENWFMIFDYLEEMREQENGQGLYRNHWYHVWKLLSTSPFNTAVVFTSQQSLSPTSISINPPKYISYWETLPLSGVPFTAVVTNTINSSSGEIGVTNAKVVWSCSAGTINENGDWFPPKGSIPQTPVNYTITATSAVDSSITATATINLKSVSYTPPFDPTNNTSDTPTNNTSEG